MSNTAAATAAPRRRPAPVAQARHDRLAGRRARRPGRLRPRRRPVLLLGLLRDHGQPDQQLGHRHRRPERRRQQHRGLHRHNLKPGSTGTRCIVVSSTGSLPVGGQALRHRRGDDKALASDINLTVTQGTGARSAPAAATPRWPPARASTPGPSPASPPRPRASTPGSGPGTPPASPAARPPRPGPTSSPTASAPRPRTTPRAAPPPSASPGRPRTAEPSTAEPRPAGRGRLSCEARGRLPSGERRRGGLRPASRTGQRARRGTRRPGTDPDPLPLRGQRARCVGPVQGTRGPVGARQDRVAPARDQPPTEWRRSASASTASRSGGGPSTVKSTTNAAKTAASPLHDHDPRVTRTGRGRPPRPRRRPAGTARGSAPRRRTRSPIRCTATRRHAPSP